MTVALKECVEGRLLFLDNDLIQGKALLHHGEYSAEEVALFRQIVRPGDVVIDVGANIGCFTVPLARMVGNAGMVIAYEPQRLLYYMLCGNLALNGVWSRALVKCEALGATTGRVRVPPLDYDNGNNFGGLQLGGTVGEEVIVSTIDSIGLPALRLLKADVEGMEADVLVGGQKTIERHRPVLYVEDHYDEKSERLLGLMLELDYILYWHLPRIVPIGSEVFPNMVSKNVLGVPRGMEHRVDLVPVDGPSDDGMTALLAVLKTWGADVESAWSVRHCDPIQTLSG